MIVRLSDFKSNEYANLIGGARYEPHEENPMLGFRGASRYVDPSFRACFELECRALQRVREDMGLTNVQIMVPFVRTLAEARAGHASCWRENGLKRGEDGLQRHHDVRAADQRAAGRAVSGVLRRHVDRLQRHDAADAGAGSRLRRSSRSCSTSATRRCKAAGDGDRRLPQGTASTSASAARARPITRTWRGGWSIRASSSMSLNPDTVVETWLFLAAPANRAAH